MWRILTASLGAGGMSGHRTIGVIPGGDQRPGQQDMSVPGARCGARRPGTAHGLHRRRRRGSDGSVRWHLTTCGVMLAGQALLALGSMRACHEAIRDGESLVQHWRVTQLTGLGIPGPLPASWRLTTAQQARLIPAATGGAGGGRPAPPARRSDTAPDGCAVTADPAGAEAGGEDPPRQEGLPCWSR